MVLILYLRNKIVISFSVVTFLVGFCFCQMLRNFEIGVREVRCGERRGFLEGEEERGVGI
jgi:hypothetical protein